MHVHVPFVLGGLRPRLRRGLGHVSSGQNTARAFHMWKTNGNLCLSHVFHSKAETWAHKGAPERAKEAQHVSRGAPRDPQEVPRRSQTTPKGFQKQPKEVPWRQQKPKGGKLRKTYVFPRFFTSGLKPVLARNGKRA